MLAFPEIIKNLFPFKRIHSKDSTVRKHFINRLGDLLAIVVSIYLALSIEGWAENRLEHKRLMHYYENILGELKTDTVTLTETIADAEKHIENTKKQIIRLRSYKPQMLDTITGMFTGMLSSQIFYKSTLVSFQSMVMSGDIKLIGDFAVRDSMVGLDEVYNGLMLWEDIYMDYFRNDIMPYAQKNFDMLEGKPLSNEYCTTIEYRNLVVFFHSLNQGRLEQYQQVLKKAREAMLVIQQELDKKK
jgi:hypothetical protein